MQLKAIKADGSIEEYFHTKVMGTISNALGSAGQTDICAAEELSEVVTYFLYHKEKRSTVATGEIFSMAKAVLSASGFEEAAIALSEHHCERKLKRSRIEVVSVDIQGFSDAEQFCKASQLVGRSRWDKSRIVNDLVTKYSVSPQTARTIASMVEQKIFNMGITIVPASLINQLVWGDAAAVLEAERQLQAV